MVAALLLQGILVAAIPAQRLRFSICVLLTDRRIRVGLVRRLHVPGVSCLLVMVGFPMAALHFSAMPVCRSKPFGPFLGVSLLVSRTAQYLSGGRRRRCGSPTTNWIAAFRTGHAKLVFLAVERLQAEIAFGHRKTEAGAT